MSEPILRCSGLTKKYGNLLALDNLNLELPKGKIIGLLGPNGSGKTTLIKLLAGLLTPTAGRVTVDGQVPGPDTKAYVSYLPERLYFNPAMTVARCVTFFSDFYADFDAAQAETMLRLLAVPPQAKLRTLSKGTREKVQLVLVMARRARLYLLDEPIGGVDPAAREYILNTILQNYRPEASVILSTHLIQDVEKILDEFLFIQNGRIYVHDTVDTVRTQKGMSLDQFFREVFRCFPSC